MPRRFKTQRIARAVVVVAVALASVVNVVTVVASADPMIDFEDERSDNYRSLVFGIKCGACKAVTSEIGNAFARTAKRHKRDADTTDAFGGRYVSQFRTKLSREVDEVCAENGVVEREWGYSEKGASNVINTTRVFDRAGVNLTQEESSMIQMTVFGLGIFTKEPSERFHYRGPPGSEEPGSDNFSLISNTFARKTLREACQAVSDSLEFDEAIDEAVSSVEEGFDFGIQHKLCLQLNYCKVKNKRGKRQSIERVKQNDGSVAYEIPSDAVDASATTKDEL